MQTNGTQLPEKEGKDLASKFRHRFKKKAEKSKQLDFPEVDIGVAVMDGDCKLVNESYHFKWPQIYEAIKEIQSDASEPDKRYFSYKVVVSE